MLRIKVNGAEPNLIARERDEGEWVLLCTHQNLGEFHLHPTDKLQLWWPAASAWVPISEIVLADLVIGLAEMVRKEP